MNVLRRISTVRLVSLIAVVAAVALLGGIALARAGGAPQPPRRTLFAAVNHSLGGAPVQGVSARIQFTNHLFPSGALPQGSASALLTGATGRLWLADNGRFRVELQSDGGDTQVMGGPNGLVVLDTSSNTEYRLPSSGNHDSSTAHDSGSGAKPASPMAGIEMALAQISSVANLSGAVPTSIAGQPAYTVRLSPKHDGGLLGALGLGFDANRPVPLRLSIYARGDSSPVLSLAATEIHYGPVTSSDLSLKPAPGVKMVTVTPPTAGASDHSHGMSGSKVTGVAAVRSAVGFPVAAPKSLVGLPRRSVRLVRAGGSPSALVVYGKGLGAVLVLQQATVAGSSSPLSQLPSVSIAGSSGNELATALGTVIRFQHGGVTTTVVGSIPAVAAEAAARQLVAQ